MAPSLRTEPVRRPDRVPPGYAGRVRGFLRVTDPNGVSDPDYVVITITSDDLQPTADCGGPDTYGQVGQATQLDGSASSDPEGARVSYTWAVSSVPACSRLGSGSIYDQGTASPSVIPDCQGLFVMSLVVDDGLQWSEPDYCTIDVRSDNRSPVAESGPGGVVPPCDANPFQLSGWESYDPDGDPLDYNWSVVRLPRGPTRVLTASSTQASWLPSSVGMSLENGLSSSK